MARSHTYSRSPAIFLYFLLFSTCCELLDLNSNLSKQASLRYAVCDPASSEVRHQMFPISSTAAIFVGDLGVDVSSLLGSATHQHPSHPFNSQIFSSVEMSKSISRPDQVQALLPDDCK